MDYHFDERLDVKLLALFVIEAFGMPVSEQMILDCTLAYPFVEYFDFQTALSEAEETGFITRVTENEIELLAITDSGREALGFFIKRLPVTVRERLRLTVKSKIKEMQNALSVVAKVERVNEVEYCARLGILEGGQSVFDLGFNIGNEAIAKQVCEAFRKNPQEMYAELLDVLIRYSDL